MVEIKSNTDNDDDIDKTIMYIHKECICIYLSISFSIYVYLFMNGVDNMVEKNHNAKTRIDENKTAVSKSTWIPATGLT